MDLKKFISLCLSEIVRYQKNESLFEENELEGYLLKVISEFE